MATSRYTTTTQAELADFAVRFAQQLQPGQVIGLVGDLGSGKTTFVQLLARAFGIHSHVISPTFLYEQTYSLPVPQDGIAVLQHLDLYRLRNEDDLAALDLKTQTESGITVIEWIERVPSLLRRADAVLHFHLDADKNRWVEVVWSAR